jgi:O-antigen chain-terminating methyltransferase
MSDDLTRLENDRLDADRRYNDALTALDRAVNDATTGTGPAGSSRDAAAATGTALLTFLQQITAFVDTKDRELAARLAARLAEHDAALAAIAELRTQITVLQRAVAGRQSPAAGQRPNAPNPAPQPANSESRSPNAGSDIIYAAFEDRFRGSTDEVRAKLRAYVPLFAGTSDVLDVGCGRGEFLELLRQEGVRARGVDQNHEMIADARDRGLDAVAADALAYVSSLPDGSLGGLIAAQVVEHLEPSYLIRLLQSASHKLRPGSPIVLETINPACWLAFFSSYLRDFTHVRPFHPDTLQYLLQASGFERVTIRYAAPVPEPVRMTAVDLPAETVAGRDPASRAIAGVAHAVNANAAILNTLLFSHLDYAAIGYRS